MDVERERGVHVCVPIKMGDNSSIKPTSQDTDTSISLTGPRW